MRLGLGTVQFGCDYGISNSLGRVLPVQVGEILGLAQQYGIQTLDTACLYGDSEKVLGQHALLLPKFNIITKTPYFSDVITEKDGDTLEECFYRSLEFLYCNEVYGLLIHNANNLMGKGAAILWRKMEDLKERGFVKKIGVSVYSSEQIRGLVDCFPIDLIQLPINVLDQRLLCDGSLDLLKKKGIEIHVRSVFLQGLLLLDPARLQPFFKGVEGLLYDYHEYIKSIGLSPLAAALNFVFSIKAIDCVLVGVCSCKQLKEIVDVVKNIDSYVGDYKKFNCTNEQIINPSLWRLT